MMAFLATFAILACLGMIVFLALRLMALLPQSLSDPFEGDQP